MKVKISQVNEDANDIEKEELKSLVKESLSKVIKTKWNLKLPNLIISITGGAQSFEFKNDLKEKLKSQIREIILNTVVSIGCWIITGGTNTGIMELVGKALNETKLNENIVLGIATYDRTAHNDKMVIRYTLLQKLLS